MTVVHAQISAQAQVADQGVSVQTARVSAREPGPARSFSVPLVGGGSMAVSCPSWCELEHVADREVGCVPEDLWHVSAESALRVQTTSGAESVLVVRVDQAPYGVMAEPTVSLWPVGDGGDCREGLGPEELAAEIARVRAHADRMEQALGQLVAARAEWATTQAVAR